MDWPSAGKTGATSKLPGSIQHFMAAQIMARRAGCRAVDVGEAKVIADDFKTSEHG